MELVDESEVMAKHGWIDSHGKQRTAGISAQGTILDQKCEEYCNTDTIYRLPEKWQSKFPLREKVNNLLSKKSIIYYRRYGEYYFKCNAKASMNMDKKSLKLTKLN